MPLVLVLGDSLSAAHGIAADSGWVSLLHERLSGSGRAQVVNASISGETTAGGLARLPELLEQHRPAVIAIELGANDGLRGLPIGQIRDNLESLVERSRQADAQVVLIGIELPVNYGPRYRGQLRAVYADLATAAGVWLVPFLLEDVALTEGMMQDDGLHPTAAAQPRILQTVWPAFDQALTGAGIPAPAPDE